MPGVILVEEVFNCGETAAELSLKLVDPINKLHIVMSSFVLQFGGTCQNGGLEVLIRNAVVLWIVPQLCHKLIDLIDCETCLKFLQTGSDLFLSEFAILVLLALPLLEQFLVGEAFLEYRFVDFDVGVVDPVDVLLHGQRVTHLLVGETGEGMALLLINQVFLLALRVLIRFKQTLWWRFRERVRSERSEDLVELVIVELEADQF